MDEDPDHKIQEILDEANEKLKRGGTATKGLGKGKDKGHGSH